MWRSMFVHLIVVVCVGVYLSIRVSASLKTKLFCEISSMFQGDNIKNETSLRDAHNFPT